MTGDELLQALSDFMAQVEEHQGMEPIMRSHGFDADDFMRAEAHAGKLLHESLAQTVFWPPQSRTDAATGLGVAWAFGALAMAGAREKARTDAAG